MPRKVISREWLLSNGVDAATLDAAIAEADRREKRAKGKAGGGGRAPSHTPGVMNYVEAKFRGFVEDGRWPHGTVTGIEFEPGKLALSPDMTYSPDFKLTLDDGSADWIEIKGKRLHDDSVAKSKMAAVLLSPDRFYLVQFKAKVWRVRRLGVAKRQTIKIEDIKAQ